MRCECGFRVRGSEHTKGNHHNGKGGTSNAAKERLAKLRKKGRKTNIGNPNDQWCKDNFPAECALFHARKI